MKKTEKKMKKTNEAEFKSFDKLDLSKIKGSVSEILTTNFEKFNDCKTAEDVINLCHELFDEAGLKTEWTNTFFYRLNQIVQNNLNPRRAYQQAMLYVNNARMKGAGLGMDRGKRIGRLYEGDDEVDESTVCNAKDNKTKKNYTKKQITEAIAYWKNVLENMDKASTAKNDMVNEKYSINDPYFRQPGKYLYIASNASFTGDIVKIGYSDDEDLCTHLTRYNTSVPDQFTPVAQIWFDGNVEIKSLEKEFMKLFKPHNGNGGKEFFDSTIQNAKKQAQMFAKRYGGQYHPY